MKLKPLQIGKLKLKNPLILAPMVEVTDLPYRIICRRAGAAMAYTEMIYIEAILHSNRKTELLMKNVKGEEDRPLGLQITGNKESDFERFVKGGKWRDFDLIDLNCGCPSIRIIGNSAGSYLLKNPEKIARIISILKKTGKPVTAKIRLGFKENNVFDVACAVEKAGADALTIHARLAVDGNSVPADWSWLKKVKSILNIPLIGNGDIFSAKDAERILRICDGAMIARGAIGDPLIFSRVLSYFKSGKEEEFNFSKNLEVFEEYLELEKKYYGKEVDLSRIKYVGGKFLRGFDGASEVREKLTKCKLIGQIEKIAADLLVENSRNNI